jgi:hypothetical protein
MQKLLTVALAVVLPALTVGPPTAAAGTGCAPTMIFEIGGAGDGAGHSWDHFNAKLPAGYDGRPVAYPGTIPPIKGDEPLDDSVDEGIANLDRAVRDYHAACPGSHITITGYSGGTLVAGAELEALSHGDDVPHGQLDGVLYGDPRRPAVPGAGLLGGAGGVMTTIPTFYPGLTMRGPWAGFGDLPVREVCNQNDGICNSENPINNLLAFANGWAGYLTGDHQYALDPIADAGSGLLFVAQQPKVDYGPPLPIPSPTPWQLFNGNPAAARDFVRGLRSAVPQLTTAFPWLADI